MKNLLSILILTVFGISCSQKELINKDNNTTSNSKNYATWMADSEMKRNPEGWTIDFNEQPKWEYTHGLVMMAMFQVWEASKEAKYLDYIKHFTEFMIDDQGEIKTYKKSDYNIDRINGGKFLIDFYQTTGEEKYKLAVEELRDQMRKQPRNSEGGFWHKQIYPHQMWLDGLYMGSPFLAKYAKVFDESALYDDVVNQILLMDKYGYSEETGLYHHAWDESKSQKWADPETGLSTNYWGRSIGWYAMAIVDVLDYLPTNHPKRDEVIRVADKLAEGIVNYQHPTGTWYQVVDQGDREGNYLESSATSMFAYFLLKGSEKGYLGEAYKTAGEKAYEGIINEFIREDEDGGISLTQVCGVAGLGGTPYRDGSYEYYVNEVIRDNDPKGVGPFILASLVYENMGR